MNKFLELVEENNPEKDIDALTDAKRSLQRLLMKSKIEAYGRAFEDILSVRLDDGRVVELEVKDVQHPIEDQEEELSDEDQAVIDDTEEAARLGHRGAVVAVRQANQKKSRELAGKVNRYNQLN